MENNIVVEEDFRNWLEKNTCGTYKGMEISPTTELVSYTYVISAIVITFRKQTPYYFRQAEKKKAGMMKFLCILCNLTLGWWGIPWGPIWTIKETCCNIFNENTAYWGSFLTKE